MSEGWLWLAALAASPVIVIVLSVSRIDVERLRRLAVVSASGMLIAALIAVLSSDLRRLSIRSTALTWVPGGEAIVRVDTLSAALLPFAASLWLLTVAVTPRAALDRGGLRRTALATLFTVTSFLTESAVVLVLAAVGAVWTFLSALSDEAHRYQRRVVAVYLGGSTLLFGVGVALLVGPGAGHATIETTGIWLIVAAALVRKGIVPFHAWVPEVFDHGRLGPAILFSAPQVGAYMTAVLIVPRASSDVLRLIAVLALATAVYGAALALVQRSARRACGYLFMSQSALVMAGLDCTSVAALAGGLLVWLSAGLAFAGLARCVLVLEARRDLSACHGGYERMPVLAIAFLAMGLACTGFPGTLGFVGQELLVQGAVDVFPVMGFAVVIASALTGLAVLRMYFALFCGRRDAPVHLGVQLGLRRREAWTFAGLVVLLVGFGVAPRPLADSTFAASEEILQRRALRALVPFQQSARDDEPLQLVGSSADEQQRRIAVQTLDREVLRVAIAAHDPHRLEHHLGGGLAGEELCHAGLDVAALAAIFLRRGGIDEEARCLDLRRHVGQLDLDRLVLGDRLAESDPLLSVPDRLLKGGPGEPEPARSQIDALGLEPGHHVLEPEALDAADQVRRRNREVVEVQLGGLHRPVPELVDVAAYGQPRRALLDDEGAHAPVGRRCGRIGLGEKQERPTVAPVGDPHLRSGHAVHAPVAAGNRADRLQIRPRVGLREADAAAQLAPGEARQEVPLLLGRAVPDQHVAEDEVRSDDAGQGHPPARQLLEDERKGRVVDRIAAVLLRNIQSEEAELPHRLDKRMRVFAAALHLGGRRDHVALHELADHRDDELLLVHIGRHGRSPDSRSLRGGVARCRA